MAPGFWLACLGRWRCHEGNGEGPGKEEQADQVSPDSSTFEQPDTVRQTIVHLSLKFGKSVV